MPYSKTTVNLKEREKHRLPDWATQGAVLLLHLKKKGYLKKIENALKIRRSGGYAAIDAFVFFVYFFTSPFQSIKAFGQWVSLYKKSLAVIADRKQMPSTSAISRLLGSVERELTTASERKILIDYTDILPVMSHSACKTYDQDGQEWHLFDFDTTRTVLRQRKLPQSSEYPEPRRRAEEFSAGYTGRKRGEVLASRAVLQHSGSGAWLYSRFNSGNGKQHQELKESLEVMKSCCEQMHHPAERTIIRTDGAYGSVPFITSYLEAECKFVSRLTRLTLFQQYQVIEILAQAQWFFFENATLSTTHSVTDLGWLTLEASERSRRTDGSFYDPVFVRVVVMRSQKEGDAHRGVVLNGWQYETFVTNLSEKKWSAAQIMHLYFGRTAQENRFFQEDKELGLDHLLSYHLEGQEWASQIGLMIWNLQISLGFSMNPPSELEHQKRSYMERIDTRNGKLSEILAKMEIPKKKEEPQDEEYLEWKRAEEELIEHLDKMDWNYLLRKRLGFHWDKEQGGIVCLDGKVLRLSSASEDKKRGQWGLFFLGRTTICRPCLKRTSCIPRAKPHTAKAMNVAISPEVGRFYASLMKRVHSLRKKNQRRRKIWVFSTTIPPFHLDPIITSSSKPSISSYYFLPSIARKKWVSVFQNSSICVNYFEPPLKFSHPFLASNIAERQQRRKSWVEHKKRYALDEESTVQITLFGLDNSSGILDRVLNNTG